MSGRSIPALLVALLLLGTTACAAGSVGEPATSPSPKAHRTIVVPTPDPLPRGVHLSFIQQRIDEGTRRSQVRVVNGDATPVHVRSVGVDWAGYPLQLHRVDYDVPGQQIVDLRYFLPRADCSAAAGAAPRLCPRHPRPARRRSWRADPRVADRGSPASRARSPRG